MASESTEPQKMKLYNFWRSSCSHRVRIVLNLKGLDYEYKSVNLYKQEHLDPEYEKLNPMKYAPTLVDGDVVVADSFAIALYLEDKYPQNPLLPKDLKKKALNIQIASIVTSSIHPRQNFPRNLKFLEGRLDSHERLMWSQHYFNKGFTAIEKLLKDCAGKYATGDEILLGDVFLEPQLHLGVKRFGIDMSKFPTLARLHQTYKEIPAFQAAVSEIQPDAPKDS